MEHPSFKTLAATFLVVATAMGSFSFFFSSSFPAQSSAPPQDVQVTVPVNPIGAEAIPPETLTSEPLTLTEAVINPLLEKISALDQVKLESIVTSKASKESVLKSLDIDQTELLASMLLAFNSAKQEVKSHVKILQEEARNKASKSVVVSNTASVSSYLDSLQDVFGEQVISLPDIQSSHPSSNALIAATLQLQQLRSRLQKIPVPNQLRDLHEKILYYFFRVGQLTAITSTSDPLKSLLVLKESIQELQGLTDSLAQQLQQLEEHAAIQETGRKSSFFRKLFVINTAYATFPVFDYIRHLWEKLLRPLAEMMADRFYERFRTHLFDKIQRQVIDWIKGNGKPKFVTDWKGFLKDTARTAAAEAVSEAAPFLCDSFGPLLTIAAIPPPNVPAEADIQCTLTDMVRNTKNFYQSFQTGGWLAYGEMLKPRNNIFGGIMLLKQRIRAAEEAKKEVKKKDAEVSNGFLSTKICAESHKVYFATGLDPKELYGDDYVKGSKQCGGKSCTAKVCDKWKSTTPGKFTVETLTQEVGKQRMERLANTLHISPEKLGNAIASIVDTLANSLMNKIIGSGIL
ncbi:hypothetical protein D6833_06790 [Candidatus Parcubacteria bacterium]|nr:MAG: hypothetical protein D6833_06790 [Candidatus Parcubacteria bacterium]